MGEDLLTIAYDDDGTAAALIIARQRNGITIIINEKLGKEARELYKALTEAKKHE